MRTTASPHIHNTVQTNGTLLDKVADAFKGIEFEIVTTNLSNEEEAELHEAFGA